MELTGGDYNSESDIDIEVSMLLRDKDTFEENADKFYNVMEMYLKKKKDES